MRERRWGWDERERESIQVRWIMREREREKAKEKMGVGGGRRRPICFKSKRAFFLLLNNKKLTAFNFLTILGGSEQI